MDSSDFVTLGFNLVTAAGVVIAAIWSSRKNTAREDWYEGKDSK